MGASKAYTVLVSRYSEETVHDESICIKYKTHKLLRLSNYSYLQLGGFSLNTSNITTATTITSTTITGTSSLHHIHTSVVVAMVAIGAVAGLTQGL